MRAIHHSLGRQSSRKGWNIRQTWAIEHEWADDTGTTERESRVEETRVAGGEWRRMRESANAFDTSVKLDKQTRVTVHLLQCFVAFCPQLTYLSSAWALTYGVLWASSLTDNQPHIKQHYTLMPQSTSDTKEEHKGFPSAIRLCYHWSLPFFLFGCTQKLLNQFKLGERMGPKQEKNL